jgi:hypothetical protein
LTGVHSGVMRPGGWDPALHRPTPVQWSTDPTRLAAALREAFNKDRPEDEPYTWFALLVGEPGDAFTVHGLGGFPGDHRHYRVVAVRFEPSPPHMIQRLAAAVNATLPIVPADHDEDDEDVAVLAQAVDDVKGVNPEDRDDVLAAMPIAGVLFLAMIGTPGERAEVDPPLVLALRAVRETLDGWARTPSPSTAFASVPFGELDRLACGVGAAIEIARRGLAQTTGAAR